MGTQTVIETDNGFIWEERNGIWPPGGVAPVIYEKWIGRPIAYTQI